MKEKQKYTLLPGVILEHSDGKVYTNDNLTDKVAEKFLAANPKAIWMFASTPSADTGGDGAEDGTTALLNRIAELEELNSAHIARIAELEELNNAADVDEVDDDAETIGGSAVAINENIKALISEQIAAGKSTEAIKTSLAGQEVGGVKLNKSLVAIYIKSIKAEA